LRRAVPFLFFMVIALAACGGRGGRPGPGVAAVLTLSPAWSTLVEVPADLQLAAVPGGFLVATPSGTFLRMSAEDGALLWRRDLNLPVEGEIAVLRDTARSDSGFAAFHLKDGDVGLLPLDDGEGLTRWPLGWEEPILSEAGGRLLALSPSGGAALYDPWSQKVLWEASLPPTARAGAADCGELLLIGLADGTLVALESRSGSVRWGERLPAPAAVAPSCTEAQVFVATVDNDLHALRLRRRSASRMWRVRSGADPVGPPLVIEGTALLLSKDTYLYGFRRRNGHLLFRTRLDRRPGPAAVLRDLVLVAGPHVRRLDAFRLPEGRSAGAFELPVGTRFLTPPVVSGDRVALAVARYGQESARIIALQPSAGPTQPPDPLP
jgi:outer membrane protein assembly factor BamB